MIALVLGGTRSGKSEIAERWVQHLAGSEPVHYLATARVDPEDTTMAARIAAHRQRRSDRWVTVECGDPGRLVSALDRSDGPVLVDSVGTWVAGHDEDPDHDLLVACLRRRRGDTVLVSDEVGLAVHAPSEIGRRFVDRLGRTNRAIAEVADHVVLVVAGRVLELPEEWQPPC